ncbi:unnamed protein product [marine sediment metagenome]|uniref:Uncharacterized protein n=1 Tax=marine sediment metagenome TaxID=412755 RepID=X0VZD3_9ZZZZ
MLTGKRKEFFEAYKKLCVEYGYYIANVDVFEVQVGIPQICGGGLPAKSGEYNEYEYWGEIENDGDDID